MRRWQLQSITDKQVRWQVKANMLRSMDFSQLDTQELDYLFGLLERSPKAGESKESWLVVANEIMEQLRKQAIQPERLTESLAALAKNQQMDTVLRDYALQHLSLSIGNQETARLLSRESTRNVIGVIAGIIDQSTVQQSSIPGTALMSLVKANEVPENQAQISESLAALEGYLSSAIVGGAGTTLSTQTTALNAVAILQLSEYLPLIRENIRSESTDPSVKLSSIAALGYLAEDEDLEYLKSMASSESKFRFAAQSSLKRLNH